MYITSEYGKIDLSIIGLSPGLEPHPPRSPGLHCSEIIRHVAIQSGILKRDAIIFGRSTFDPIDECDLPLAIALGLAWENFLAPQYPDMVRPAEVHKDGIYMSPDGVSYGPHLHSPTDVLVLEEIKLTWKSMSKPIHENQLYLMQCMAYCYALDTHYCRLHVTHVNGNYHFGDDDGGGPHYLIHSITFSQSDLEDNWGLLMYNSQLMSIL